MTVKRPYVFGIGTAKTGSHSLAAALEQLGLSAYHTGSNKFKGNGDTWRQLVENRKENRSPIEGVTGFDALMDHPVWEMYQEIDKHVEGAKFILTYRPPEDCALSWSRMIHKRYENAGDGVRKYWKENPYKRFMDMAVNHIDDVFTYFHARPDDLLVLDMRDESKTKWNLLGEFLGIDPPEGEPFPKRFAHQHWEIKNELL